MNVVDIGFMLGEKVEVRPPPVAINRQSTWQTGWRIAEFTTGTRVYVEHDVPYPAQGLLLIEQSEVRRPR